MHRGEAGVVKTTFRDTADERHLAAFKTNADGATGTCGLAFATATSSFATAAGFALTKPFTAVL
jgi:hypothetical protein